MRIDVGRPRHHLSKTVEARVAAYEAERDAAIRDGSNSFDPITDDVAVTIASWYMTPNGYGMAFTTLAQKGIVDTEDLTEAIDNEIKLITAEPHHYYPAKIAISELSALHYWATAKEGGI